MMNWDRAGGEEERERETAPKAEGVSFIGEDMKVVQ